MHKLYPVAKGDPLCPLGFHPQVRWPTRCKRCFRDYKEHGGKRIAEDITASSPILTESSSSRNRDDGRGGFDKPARSWTSSQNLSTMGNSEDNVTRLVIPKRPSSWTSTPDLEDNDGNSKAEVTVSISLPPRRRHTMDLEQQLEESFTLRRPPIPPPSNQSNTHHSSPSRNSMGTSSDSEEIVILKSDSLAERVRKMQMLKRQQSLEREGSRERSVPRKIEKEKSPNPEPVSRKHEEPIEATVRLKPRAELKPPLKPKAEPKLKPVAEVKPKSVSTSANAASTASQDVQFLIQVKDQNKSTKRQDDNASNCTETTATTIVDYRDKEMQEQVDSLQRDLDTMKLRCERAERDKSDILLRRLASMDTAPKRTAASEALKLQQKCNELKQQVEDLRDDRKCLALKVRELEMDLISRPAKNLEEDLRNKLQSAETLCEELMDENEDMKRELRNMEQEIDEMQDNFREDQADEYTTVKKDLEMTTKNCRVLSFKLKKCERKIESLENDKQAMSQQANSDLILRVKLLEEELKAAKEDAEKYQSEFESSNSKRRAPSLGVIGRSASGGDGKMTRASLTRGDSQDDAAQLQRDLHDSMEREADLREQLKFAEEEGESLRKKASRVEDDNESLMMQLKKMATKARSRKISPTAPSRLTPEPAVEKDEGISDEEDPAELRLLLELNEQEASLLRRRVEELENENESSKRQLKELESRIITTKENGKAKLPSFILRPSGANKESPSDTKLKTLEDELTVLKKKITEKDKAIDQLHADVNRAKAKTAIKSNSLDSPLDTQSVNLKRQLQMVEQEASVLRSKMQTVEQENEKLGTENKKLQLQAARASRRDSSVGGTDKDKNADLLKAKEMLVKAELERDEVAAKLKNILETSADKLEPRVKKIVTDASTKVQMKKCIDELEQEITETRAMLGRMAPDKLRTLEIEKASVQLELKDCKDQLTTALSELKTLKSKKDTTATQKLTDLEQKLKKTEDERKHSQEKVSKLEDQTLKLEGRIKSIDSSRASLETQLKTEKEQITKLEKEIEKDKKERAKLESKLGDIDSDLQAARKSADKAKTAFEKEIATLKSKSSSNDSPTKKMQELKEQNEKLTVSMAQETKKYNELTTRYEVLEEEHVLTKAQLTTNKEKLQCELSSLQQQVKSFKENEVTAKQETTDLTKRLSLSQAKLSEMEKKDSRSVATIELERNRLRTGIEEKDRTIEGLRREREMNVDLASQLKKECDELRQKLDDFDRLSKKQRSISDQNSSMEQEIKILKAKLEHSEMSVKSEVASTRLRYEQQVGNLQAEMVSLQRQCERFKRDRDTFKQLLEGAQKTIGDLKQNSGRLSRASNNSGDEDDKSKILTLEQQVGCLEDELSEARLEASKFKTELVSERSGTEIKISEMKSKMNEYEEERLLGSGRSKVPGLKTKLELSWQKEREDQQRLLQETSTLARDLRQTLFEVERERDKERLESRRKIDHQKRATEEEMEEGRKKISELQCDLLELRDAHAKLRTANEKLRRERDRYEKDRDSISKRRFEQDGERKVGALLQTVDELVKIAPDLQMAPTSKSVTLATPTPPRRGRSPSPGPGSIINISSVLARLAEASEELRHYQRVCEDDRERERNRRGGMRRAASTENEMASGEASSRHSSRIARNSGHNGSLYRKSLSLDQSMQQEQMIWKQDDNSMSSLQSIDSDAGNYVARGGRDSSLDSRLSGGSTQSDIPHSTRKKKRGLMGKLRSLTKTKSVDSDASHQGGSDSDVSIASDHHSSKKDLKGRLSGMFRRAGSNSRSNSTERGTASVNAPNRPVAIMTISADLPPTPSSATLPRKGISRPTTPMTTPSALRRAK